MTFTLDQINRAFFEAIRLKLVALGHLPDVLIYNTDASFKTACDALTKPLIKIFGVGNYKARQGVKNNKIVIDRLNISQGSIGFVGARFVLEELEDPESEAQQEAQQYQQITYPQRTENVNYQISYVCSDNAIDNLIRTIILSTLDVRGRLKGVNANRTLTENYFLYDKTNEAESNNDGFIERYLRYEVSNVLLIKPQIITAPKVKTITIDTEIV